MFPVAMEQQCLKTEAEIRHAHNLLLSVLMVGEALNLDEGEAFDTMMLLTVLCWLFGHDHSPFGALLVDLEARLAQHGFVLTDGGVLHRGARGPVH